MKKLSVCLLTTFIFGALVASPYAFGEGETKTDGVAGGAATAQEITDARKEAADTGYTENVPNIQSAIDKLAHAAEMAPNVALPHRADIMNLQKAVSYYARFHGTCVTTQATASGLCREQTSPQLQDTLNSINTVASMITGVAVKDSCSTFAKIAKIGQMGLTAYTAACSTARGACEAACTNVKSNLDTMVKIMALGDLSAGCLDPMGTNCATIQTAAQAVIAVGKMVSLDANPNDPEKKSIAIKDRACTYSYANMLVSAGAGIASMISGLKAGQNCDDQSNGTGGSTPVASADLTAKCAKAENAQLPECLCISNPRLPGCANALQKAGESTSSNFSALSSPNAGSSDKSGSGGPDLSGGSDRGLASDSNSKSGDSAGGVGAPTGGGGGGFGGGGGGFGGGSAAGAGGAGDKKGLSANILGGAGGGGGGGGSWGSGGSSSDNAKLRPYLPGGDKDPNKMAGQQNWTKEVTGQGGKSNWEKVRDRYRDNNSSLLNN